MQRESFILLILSACFQTALRSQKKQQHEPNPFSKLMRHSTSRTDDDLEEIGW